MCPYLLSYLVILKDNTQKGYSSVLPFAEYSSEENEIWQEIPNASELPSLKKGNKHDLNIHFLFVEALKHILIKIFILVQNAPKI